MQALTDAESADVQQRGGGERQQRKNDVERRVRGKISPLRLPHEKHVTGREVQHSREVGKIACPVSPGSYEAGEVYKGALRQDVEAAFIRITRRKFDDRKRERHVEDKPGADPDDDRTRAGRGSRGEPPQTDAGDYVEEQQVAKSHDPLGPVGTDSVGDGDAGLGGDGRWF